MADEDGFLSRWSRRKQAQRAAPPADKPVERPQDESTKPAADGETTQRDIAAPATETVDLASLPPIESLGADSDYTTFLRPGVPDSLRLAALRQLWLTEPSVRDYEALVDYAWNFNAPGYGQLLPTDDVEKLLKAVFHDGKAPREASDGVPTADAANVSEPPKSAPQYDHVRHSENRAAPPAPEPPSSPAALPKANAETDPDAAGAGAARRRHGAALPQSSPDREDV